MPNIQLDIKSSLWNVLGQSPTINVYLDTMVDGIPTRFVKVGAGICLCVAVPEEALSSVCSKNTVFILEQDARLLDRVVIGRIFHDREDISPNGCWPLVADDLKLNSHFEKAVEQFCILINRFANWDTFNSYLEVDIGYDAQENSPFHQPIMEYWWLVAEEPGSVFHQMSRNRKQAVLIRPNDKKIPVFTSSLYAALFSTQYYKYLRGNSLHISPIPCLGCFLTGFSTYVGPRVVRGAILNEQWHIDFYSCAERHPEPNLHFFINGGVGQSFTLIGCADYDNGPIWASRKWDKDGMWFSPPCNPVDW